MISALRLLRSHRVGIATFNRLLEEHGSPELALEALPKIAAEAGVRNYAPCPEAVVRAELRDGQRAGARLIAKGMADYPMALLDLPDAPPFLWVKGRRDLLHSPAIAMVGARNASSLGTRMAKRLAMELGAEGFCIVSGLARGVDTAAHLSALDTGTIAVVAGGVDVIYPLENTGLTGKIAEQGVLLSEQPIGLRPMARHFPTRNRLISGLAKAVVVVEAAAKSGSLITARNALDQGRDVLAVPGHPIDPRASGCNLLIRDGATLVRNGADVIEAISRPVIAKHPAPPTKPSRSLREVADLHRQILGRLGPSPMAEDQLIRDLSVPAGAVTPVITDLELSGKIERHAGGLLAVVAADGGRSRGSKPTPH